MLKYFSQVPELADSFSLYRCVSSNPLGNVHTISCCQENICYLQGAVINNGPAISTALLITNKDDSFMHQSKKSEVLPCFLFAPEEYHSALSNQEHYLTGSKKARSIIFIPKLIKMCLEGLNTMLFHINGKPHFIEEPTAAANFIFHITHCKSTLHRISATLTGKYLKFHSPFQEGNYSQTCIEVQLPLRV